MNSEFVIPCSWMKRVSPKNLPKLGQECGFCRNEEAVALVKLDGLGDKATLCNRCASEIQMLCVAAFFKLREEWEVKHALHEAALRKQSKALGKAKPKKVENEVH